MDIGDNNRDYDVYTDLMSDDPVVEQKFNDIKNFIRPGIVADDGCGDGALLSRVSELYPDTVLIGADLSEEMIERTEERSRIENFQDSLITTHQIDITESISRFGPSDTIISSSTFHEIWSYGDKDEELENYLWNKHHELSEGGRLIIRDVVGPEDTERNIGVWLDSENGTNTDIHASFDEDSGQTEHLDSLSTRARFHRFEEDFEGREYTGVKDIQNYDGKELLVMEAADAAEYLLTKDYTENWDSEMSESFTHWSQMDFETALEKVGFDVIHSETYTNSWIEENRFEEEAEMYEIEGEDFVESEYPPTNIVLVGEK